MLFYYFSDTSGKKSIKLKSPGSLVSDYPSYLNTDFGVPSNNMNQQNGQDSDIPLRPRFTITSMVVYIKYNSSS